MISDKVAELVARAIVAERGGAPFEQLPKNCYAMYMRMARAAIEAYEATEVRHVPC